MLRNAPQWRGEDDELVRTGAALNSQVGGADVRARAAALRSLSPGPMLIAADTETGSGFAADGTDIPPLMSLGAANRLDLAEEWGRAVGWEGRRLGLDVTWSPVLDVNTNPDNPIINVRSFGEDPERVARLGAAVVRGFRESGLHCCAKHWPGHGDIAVDSHIALPTVSLDLERLRRVEWLPYRTARDAGLESVMTGHLRVPAIDADDCATTSALLLRFLRDELALPGPHFTDSLGMEGLRTTLDSAEAAWRALAAGHDLVLVDYKRSPAETVEAVVQAVRDGRLPLERLQEAAAPVQALKRRCAAQPPAPAACFVRHELARVAREVAQAAVTPWRWSGAPPVWGQKPLLIVCDDLQRRGVHSADELGQGSAGQHPAVAAIPARFGFEAMVLDESPTAEAVAQALARAGQATAVLGVTFARISSYKGGGVRLPEPQKRLWCELRRMVRLRALLLFESPYALADLPGDVPVLVGYGGDRFSVEAAVATLFARATCLGRLPVSVAVGRQ
jgi:beta-N-acetylhexosaminidase